MTEGTNPTAKTLDLEALAVAGWGGRAQRQSAGLIGGLVLSCSVG